MRLGLFKQIAKYYHTIKYLKLIQMYGQIRLRTKKVKIHFYHFPPVACVLAAFIPPILKSTPLLSPHEIAFLNKTADISAETIWSDAQFDKLWRYHLHYFDVINSLNTEDNKPWLHDLIKRWIKENPAFLGDGWEPYPISLRIVNWIKWILSGNSVDAEVIHSLIIQTRYLVKKLEIHILGNHLLANAKALLFSSLFFDGAEAKQWFKKGIKLFDHELKQQILSDGGHFELSPMYHSIILDDLLDVINLFKTYGQSIPNHWLEISNNMFFWLEQMCHGDGHIAFFNDSALGVAPTLQALKEYRKRLLLASPSLAAKNLTHLAASGYCRMQFNEVLLLIDIAKVGASYQPGHAHADSLSFELSFGQQRLFVNSGTSTYADNEERLRQRGTKAHNTLIINDRDSSEIWKSFRVGRRAEIKNIEVCCDKDTLFLKASHNGYYRMNNIIHTRSWQLRHDDLIINDNVMGRGQHIIEIAFHVHPTVFVEKNNDHSVTFYDKKNKRLARMSTDHPLEIVDTTYHPNFNVSLSNKKIVIITTKTLPAKFNTGILLQHSSYQ